ncbi:MAG: hypothetical protein HQM16_17395 [Deltaproteobacteria bacterium]|nr:hypothetical protein [Deltaproteobacteria bacterium]
MVLIQRNFPQGAFPSFTALPNTGTGGAVVGHSKLKPLDIGFIPESLPQVYSPFNAKGFVAMAQRFMPSPDGLLLAGRTGFSMAPATQAPANGFTTRGDGLGGPSNPSGGGKPLADHELIEAWLKAMGVNNDDRVKALGFPQRMALARLASEDLDTARLLVESAPLRELPVTGFEGLDQLSVVLTMFARLMQSGVGGLGQAFLTDRTLLSINSSDIRGALKEISYSTVVAENAALNGYDTIVAGRRDVPWHLVPEALLTSLEKAWPKIDRELFKKIKERAEIDTHVVGDRLVEVKSRVTDDPVYSLKDSHGNDATYVRSQLQSLKLLAIAKGEGLRGVEFALFAQAVDPQWLSMTINAAKQMGMGLCVTLYIPGRMAHQTLVDTMPVMIPRTPLVVRLPNLLLPEIQQDNDWGVSSEAVEFMLGFISESKVRSAASGGPTPFHKAVRTPMSKAIMAGFKKAIDDHFAKLLRGLDDDTRQTEQQRISEEQHRWMKKWGFLNKRVTAAGNVLGRTVVKEMAQFAGEITDLLITPVSAAKNLVACFRFLENAIPTLEVANQQLRELLGEIETATYLRAPHLMRVLDQQREHWICGRLDVLLSEHGFSPLEQSGLKNFVTFVEGLQNDPRLNGQRNVFNKVIRDFYAHWQRATQQLIPDARKRWLVEMEAMVEATHAEPFPVAAADEFLARFAKMSRNTPKIKPTEEGDSTLSPYGDWADVYNRLGLDGKGGLRPLSEELQSALTVLGDYGYHSAEIDRLVYALEGVELFHVGGDEDVFYYLPHVYLSTRRMIRQVLLTAQMRARQKSTLGIGGTFLYPWVISKGQIGQQPFWLEVAPSGSENQLVLQRVVVAGDVQIRPDVIDKYLKEGLVLQVPREDGGTESLRFDLVESASGMVPIDTIPIPNDIEEQVDLVITAGFRDRLPVGRFVEGQSRFEPVGAGFKTSSEIAQMGLRDAYASRKTKEHSTTEDLFSENRIRGWAEFIERELEMRRTRGEQTPPVSRYFLRVRLSHRGRQRLLVHFENIRKDFGDHLRLRRVADFQIATEIAATEQRDVYERAWTHNRLIGLYNAINEMVPEEEKGVYIRKFRSTAGGGRYESLNPGQIALDLRALKNSRWGIYFRLRKPNGSMLRQEMLEKGTQMKRMVELLVQFIETHAQGETKDIYVSSIRGDSGRPEKLFNLIRIRDAFCDRLPSDLLEALDLLLRPVREPGDHTMQVKRTRQVIVTMKKRLNKLREDSGSFKNDIEPSVLALLATIAEVEESLKGPVRSGLTAPLHRKLNAVLPLIDRLEIQYERLGRSARGLEA